MTLSTLKRLLAEASKGPWVVGPDGMGSAYILAVPMGYDGEFLHLADASLIAALHTAAPALIEAIEAADALAEEVHADPGYAADPRDPKPALYEAYRSARAKLEGG